MFLYYINWKFQASNRLLRLHSPMCAGNPEDRFYRDTAHISLVSKLVLGIAFICQNDGLRFSLNFGAIGALVPVNRKNKTIIMSSFKSSRDIQKKEGGPDSCFG